MYASTSFTPREITQLCALVHTWVGGSLLPVDGRTISRPVRTYALSYGLLRVRKDGRMIPGEPWTFTPYMDLPIEALWQMFQPLLNGQRTRGASLANDPRWETLNIYPACHRQATGRDTEAQQATLGRLSAHGFLYVQIAGSLWEITDRTYRTE